MLLLLLSLSFFFFFNDTATTEIYTLSLHDALPISTSTTQRVPLRRCRCSSRIATVSRPPAMTVRTGPYPRRASCATRSEEHTSELQSRLHLVCRLLLEKKKKITITTINAL